MQELTLMMLIIALVFFVLHLVLMKHSELNIMSIIFSVIALAVVLEDETIGDDLIYFVIPLFYTTAMSAVALFPRGDE